MGSGLRLSIGSFPLPPLGTCTGFRRRTSTWGAASKKGPRTFLWPGRLLPGKNRSRRATRAVTSSRPALARASTARAPSICTAHIPTLKVDCVVRKCRSCLAPSKARASRAGAFRGSGSMTRSRTNSGSNESRTATPWKRICSMKKCGGKEDATAATTSQHQGSA